MAYTRKSYAGAAAATTLASGITNTSLSINGINLTGWPDGSVAPFVVVLGRGTSVEEKVLCSARVGNALTVAGGGRGFDTTIAASHNPSEALEHVITATDADEANQAVLNTLGRLAAVGDLLVATSSTALGRIPIGPNTQVLTSNGATAAWAAPSAGLVTAPIDQTALYWMSF